LHDRLLPLLPLVGRWRGRGAGVVATSGAEFAFGQYATFTHDGRPFLAYESRSWLLDDAGAALRPAWRETGFWRPGDVEDDLEVVIAANTGQSLTFTGTSGDLRWEIATTSATPTASAVSVDGERRLYAVMDGRLAYATELAPHGEPYAAHLNARLDRIE
jgi:hypothetical protein